MMKTVSLEVAGKLKKGVVQKIGETLWVHFDGETFIYQPELKTKKRRASGGSSASDVSAPMPGKITKIGVQTGAQVSEGQLVVVLEAMKMEYSLKATQNGSVKSINCKVGDQVSLGQILVAIEPEKVK